MRFYLRVATCLAAVTFAAVALTPLQAAVRPPKLQYQITTLPNGLRVILSEDHSTPIVHVSVGVSRRLEERARRAAPASRTSSST